MDERWLLRRAGSVLEALPFLPMDSAADRSALAEHLRPRHVSAGCTVVRQGEAPDGFYLIRGGVASVEQVSPDGDTRLLATLGPGDYFGELTLLNQAPRSATVRARTPLELYFLDSGHFHRWIENHVRDESVVRRRMIDRARLERFPLLSGLTPSERDQVLAHSEMHPYGSGETIVRQGDTGDRFYLIADGRCEVLVRPDGTSPAASSATRSPSSSGEYFGEIALLYDVPRTATVRALEPTTCYTIDRIGFAGLLEATTVAQTTYARLAIEPLSDARPGFGAVLS